MAVGGGIRSAASAYVRARKRIPTWAIKPLRRIRTRLRIKLLHCFCADWVNPAFATCPPKYTAQFLSPAVIRNFAKDPNCDMTEDFLVEALSKGDECFGILDGRTLAAYSWYASQPTRIRPRDLMMQIDGRYVYMYKGFTSDAYRGQRLHAIGKTLALQTYMSRGFRGIISYVEFDNAESLKSTRRMGARLVGSIFILGVFGHYLIYRTRGCRKFGVHITRPSPGSEAPSTDTPSPLKFE